jgi:small GTP-binding protein
MESFEQFLKKQLVGPWDYFKAFRWSPNFTWLAAGGSNNAISIWDTNTKKQIQLLEGHTNGICNLSISFDGKLLASNSYDNTIRLWRIDTWDTVAILDQNNIRFLPLGLAFHPSSLRLATLGENDKAVRIWDIDYDVLIGNVPIEESVHYTTAKLVLVGDSGVGKTGLGWRLACNEFKEHSSTHGQQFWVIPELGIKRKDGTECEAVLWDLAGQPDYRLVHSLYLDDVDTAMILFDPTNRQEPLAGVDFWLNQLKDKDKKLRNSILIGARTDRGTPTLTDAELQTYCERNGILGGYIPTSAMNGNGLPELMEKLKSQIPWNQMTSTVTTVTFKRIKEFVLALKAKPKRENILVQPNKLQEQLQAIDKGWQFSDAEMMTAVGHLENHGYVKILHDSNGEDSILLAPDILTNLASSIILEARRNPRGLGVLEEARLLRSEYTLPELNNLNEEERKILLDAATVLFLEHNLCFRETFNQQVFLVFPSLINEKRPFDETVKMEEGASYQVRGPIENIYASLVVLLGYTNTFVRTHQWQNQAQYELGEGEICGFQQASYADGRIELVLYYGLNTPESVRLMFRGLFERFLSRRELEISRYQTVSCPKCYASLARNVVLDQLNKGKNFSFCHECGEKVALPDPELLTRLSHKEEATLDAQQTIAQYRTAFEAALVRVKGLLRDQGKEMKPSCFISYAWGVSAHERWVLQLAKDLRNADIDVLLDRWHNPPGTSLTRFTDHVLSSDFVVVVGTPKLREKYETRSQDPIVAAELRLINTRLRKPSKYGPTVIPALIAGDFEASFAPLIQDIVSIDFRTEEQHFVNLFNLIWRLYELPFDNPLLEELQASMTPQEKI